MISEKDEKSKKATPSKSSSGVAGVWSVLNEAIDDVLNPWSPLHHSQLKQPNRPLMEGQHTLPKN